MDNLSPAKLKRALLEIQQQYNLPQDAVLQLEKEILAGKAQQLLDFKHTPVDIETFLTDPYFLGGVTKDSWPKPIDSVIEIIEGKFNEVILTGSTGRSKNTRANWIVAYNLYYLSCLTKPAEYCNLLSDSKIVLVLMNRTDKSAKDVTFGKFYSLITSTPYFKEDYKWDNEFKTKLAFPSDNIEVIYTVASPNNSALGEDTILFLGDEFNFMEVTDKSKKAEGNVYNQARDTYNTLMARIKGRFLTDKYIPSTSVVTTSRSSDSDFTSWRLSQLESEGLKSGFERIDHNEGYSIGKTYVSDGNQWDFRPSVNEDGSIRYGGKKFYFAISDGKNPSEILESIDSDSDTKGREILEVPEEYRKEFTDDPDKALADIAGRVSKGTGRYFASYMKHIYNSTTDYTSKKFEPLFAEYDSSVDTWDLDHGYPPINPKYVVLNQHVPRFCHIDLALTGDNAGISIGYSLDDMPVGEFNNTYDVERKPKIVYEACIGITPPREGQINFEMIRQMLYYLKEKIGVNLRYVSLDGFACISGESLILTGEGLKRAKDVNIGDIVQSRSGPNKVKNVWSYGKQKGKWLTTKNTNKIFATNNHKFEIASKIKEYKNFTDDNICWEWKCVDAIELGDRIKTSVSVTDIKNTKPLPLIKISDVYAAYTTHNLEKFDVDCATEDIMEFVGLVWGDGNFEADGVRIACNIDEIDDLCSFIYRLFDKKSVKILNSKDNCKYISISCRKLKRWFEVNHFDKKEIPLNLKTSDYRLQSAFFRGLLSADGTVGKRDGKISLSTCRYDIAEYFKNFFGMVYGIRVSISQIDNSKYEATKSNGLHYIASLSDDRLKVYNALGGFIYKTKDSLAKKFLHIKGRPLKDSIVKIEDGEEEVFDFEIENDHSYLANCIVSHNSQDMMQILEANLFEVKYISVSGKNSLSAYKSLRTAFGEGTITIPPNKLMLKEFRELVYDGKVIDHPMVSETGEEGSNDITDAITGVHKNIMEYYHLGELYDFDNYEVLSLYG